MKMTIPNELFNAIDIPSVGSGSDDAVRVCDFLKTIAFHMPNCSDLTIEREFWNTVCDFAERCGALLEKKTAESATPKVVTVTSGSYGDFQRFVGAGIGSAKVGTDKITIAEAASGGYSLTVDSTASGTAYAIYSVVPDTNATHDKTPTTSSGTTTYPNDNWKMPKWFAKTYQSLLVAGTSWRLFGMSGRAWTDFNAARSSALKYNREINRVSHGLITAGMRKQALMGAESVFIGNAQQAQQTTTTTTKG